MTIKDNENIVLDSTENVEEQATERLVDGASVDTNEVVENTDTTDKKTYTEADIDKLVNEKLDKISEVNKVMVSNDIEVKEIGVRLDSLEDYFLKLVGKNQMRTFNISNEKR